MNKRFVKKVDPNTLVLLKQIGVGVLVLGGVALLLTGVWYGTRMEALTLTTVEARGGETIESAVVEARAQAVLEGEYLGFIPRRFAWLYPEKEVRAAAASVERIHNIQVTRMSGTALSITYDEYIPYALWCSEVNAAACVFLDTTGYAFAMAPNLSGGAFMRFVTSGRVPEIGQVLLDEAQLSALVRLVALLAAQEWFISHIEIDQVGDVFLQVVGGGELKVTAADDPDAVVENLLVVLASPEFTHITPGNFQYIDLRFGNKVFLNEEMIAPPVEYASNTPTDIQ